ncbi:MAG: hypothetical protein IT580_06625 [Verrucomicrobiales bacterium]|nr:hypothetical protein [Verrucomicrobiales bacterium]
MPEVAPRNARPGVAEFEAPWGATQRVVSLLVLTVLPLVLVGTWVGMPGLWLRLTVATGILVLLAVGLGSMVLGYRVESDALYVRRPLRETRIPLAGLRAAECDAGALTGSLRLFGNGGFLSFTGWYWNRRLGRFQLFANDPSHAVVMRFRDRVVVVAPSEPATFAARLSGACHG